MEKVKGSCILIPNCRSIVLIMTRPRKGLLNRLEDDRVCSSNYIHLEMISEEKIKMFLKTSSSRDENFNIKCTYKLSYVCIFVLFFWAVHRAKRNWLSASTLRCQIHCWEYASYWTTYDSDQFSKFRKLWSRHVCRYTPRTFCRPCISSLKNSQWKVPKRKAFRFVWYGNRSWMELGR